MIKHVTTKRFRTSDGTPCNQNGRDHSTPIDRQPWIFQENAWPSAIRRPPCRVDSLPLRRVGHLESKPVATLNRPSPVRASRSPPPGPSVLSAASTAGAMGKLPRSPRRSAERSGTGCLRRLVRWDPAKADMLATEGQPTLASLESTPNGRRWSAGAAPLGFS